MKSSKWMAALLAAVMFALGGCAQMKGAKGPTGENAANEQGVAGGAMMDSNEKW